MSRIYLVFAVAGLLTACGGGSDSPAAPTTAAVAAPAPAPVQTTTPVNPPVGSAVPLAGMPAVSAGAFKVTAAAYTSSINGQESDVTFSGAVNLTVSGQLNKIWVGAKTAGGTATVSGNQNTIVFRTGVDATVSVTGTANTFILPEGSPIKIDGSGAASSTIQYYKP